MPARTDLHTVMMIGSGPIVIGQACEFDYSGCQAIQALQEDGYRVVLVNPNPATMMTTPGVADAIYMDPLTPEYLEKIIAIERPDALLPTMGGQTALNAALTLDELGILSKYGVELIGAKIDAIRIGEDRGLFRKKMDEIGLQSAASRHVHSQRQAAEYAQEFGFPLIIRPSFTLGGLGGQAVHDERELSEAVRIALQESGERGVLIEESLLGWGEFELEVMRDRVDNAVIVCAIENVDSMGIHTGDSITVAPPQTLPDTVYQRMRTMAIDILRAVGVDCGGSNVQFAYNPLTDQLRIIEMNPRVSRSSALASKATGFPIARCATRLAVGYRLSEIMNEITKKTNACFEPSLDYCAVKVARFEVGKFQNATARLGTSMKAIGESLSLGRTFIEALNKALRAAEIDYHGLEPLREPKEALMNMLTQNHPHRILAAFTLLWREECSVDRVVALGGYHPWFVEQLRQFADFCHRLLTAPANHLACYAEAKRHGMSDAHIEALLTANPTSDTPRAVEALRKQPFLPASYHCVDTCAGEFEARSPYYYATYGEINECAPLSGDKVLIIGSGPNRIGQGLEFDTCCTLCARAYAARGVQAIMVNSNPETVSTDHNISARLYLEPVEMESVLAIIVNEWGTAGNRSTGGAKGSQEPPPRVVVQLGGQTALNMADALQKRWAAVGDPTRPIEIIGTSLESIHAAEDRARFSALVQGMGLRIPRNETARTIDEVDAIVERIGFPVLVRPSFVLGGARMAIVTDHAQLQSYLDRMAAYGPGASINLQFDEFIEDAFEYDIDAVSDGERVYIAGIMEHIESAGIHSGDSACVFPPYKYRPQMKQRMIDATVAIARKLKVRGFMNIQFAVKDDDVYIIEVNPRVSRTVPFVSKTSGVNLIDIAVDIWCGKTLIDLDLVPNGEVVSEGHCLYPSAVKEAVFSFSRFPNFDPQLGPEMRSTGESIGIGRSFGAAYAKATAAAGVILPTEGSVGISVNDSDKQAILPIATELQRLGFILLATRGTAQFLFNNGIFCSVLLKAHEGNPNMVDYIRSGKMHFIINTPLGGETQHDDSVIRIAALRHHIPYTTTTSAAEAALEGIVYRREQKPDVTQLRATERFTTNLL